MEQDNIDLQKHRIDADLKKYEHEQSVRKIIYGTAIVGVATAFFPFAQKTAEYFYNTQITEIQTNSKKEIEELKTKLQKELATLKHELAEKQHDLETQRLDHKQRISEREYLEGLAPEARSQNIDKRINIAEFYSFLASKEARVQWAAFRDYLYKRQAEDRKDIAKFSETVESKEATVAQKAAARKAIEEIERRQNPEEIYKTPQYNKAMPPNSKGQTIAGRKILSLAVDELNAGVHEVNQYIRVGDYWKSLGSNFDGKSTANGFRVPWSAAFISWLVSQSGNPFKLSLSNQNVKIWYSAREKNLVLSSDATPVPGDLMLIVTGWARADDVKKASLDEKPYFPAGLRVVYGVTNDRIEAIGGNIADGVNLVSTSRNSDKIVGFIRLEDPETDSPLQ